MGQAVTDDRLRILMLSAFPPALDARNGGAKETARLAATLLRHADVRVLFQHDEGAAPHDERLVEQGLIVDEVVRPAPKRLRVGRAAGVVTGWIQGEPKWVSHLASARFSQMLRRIDNSWRPTVLHVEHTVMGRFLDVVDPALPRVLRPFEPAAASARELATLTRGAERVSAAIDVRVWQRFERRVVSKVDAVAALTEEDRAALLALGTGTLVECIPLIGALPSAAGDADDGRTIVFVANFAHGPNVEAARRLARSILPAVRKARPEARLLLVGEGSDHLGLAGSGVVVTGAVDHVEPHLASAAVVAIPLRLGGGMRVKLQEALAAGKAVVASRRATAGLALSDGRELVIADSDDQLVRHLAELLEDGARRRALGEEARAWASRAFDPDAVASAFLDLYARVRVERGRRRSLFLG